VSPPTFKDKDWSERFKSMGDEAETVFEDVYPQGFVRFGLNRPPIQMGALPPKVRYTPDYLTSKGFVEVQGLGQDRIFKIKHEKLDALFLWHSDFRADLFLWDRTAKRYGFVRLADLEPVLVKEATTRHFIEDGAKGKPYYALRIDLVPTTHWYELGEPMKAGRE
jgi:hypothetical protein